MTESTYAGAPLTFRLRHRGVARTVTLHAAADQQDIVALPAVFASLLLSFIGIALVLLRPSRMTWAFLLVGVCGLLSSLTIPLVDPGYYLTFTIVSFATTGMFSAALLVFAS